MSEPLFKVGDKCSVEALDKTEPPHRRLGSPATVESVERGRSQTGILYRVRGTSGHARTLDQAWLNRP